MTSTVLGEFMTEQFPHGFCTLFYFVLRIQWTASLPPIFWLWRYVNNLPSYFLPLEFDKYGHVGVAKKMEKFQDFFNSTPGDRLRSALRDDLSRCQMYIELSIVCVCYLCQQFNCDFSCDVVAVVVSMLFRLFQASVVS